MPEQAVRAVGHRGAAAYAPENTLPSFAQALRLGARAIEFDVRVSSDGVPVVIHDATVDRTTNGHGLVDRLTSAALAKLDAGSWFAPQFAGAGIPTLDEALETIGHAMPVAELKVPVDPELLEAAFRRHGSLERSLVISFHAPWLLAVRRHHRAFRIGLLAEQWRDSLPAEARQLGAEVLILGVDVLTLPRAVAAQELGLELWCYTANDVGLVAACAAMGVRGIITDRPDLIRVKS